MAVSLHSNTHITKKKRKRKKRYTHIVFSFYVSSYVFEKSDISDYKCFFRLTLQHNYSSATRVKTQPMMTPQWFILMAKLLIYQIRFQSAANCAKTGPRKENPFVWGRIFKI